MINQIFLDTNIFRQLGLDFTNHLDYVNLKRYCYGSGSEIRLSEVVIEELLNYYESEIINASVTSIQKAISKLKTVSEKMTFDFCFNDLEKGELLDSIRNQIVEGNMPARNEFIKEKDLIDFLIFNKQNIKKDNTRDFLIFLSAVNIAIKYPKDQIVIISNDNIFENNDYFREYLKTKKNQNIKNYKSIASFMGEYSLKLDYVTNLSLLKLITPKELKKQINKDINSIPGYISRFYYSTRRRFKVEVFDIKDIKVTNFYIYKDLESKDLKVLFHVVPDVNIVFEPEKDFESLNRYLNQLSNEQRYDLETFDEKYRPIYNTEILFIYVARIDTNSKTIDAIEFIDFFPDYYHLQDSYNP